MMELLNFSQVEAKLSEPKAKIIVGCRVAWGVDMPTYTVEDVLDIIKGLTAEQKQELENKLPSVLGTAASPTATQAVEDSSQNIQGANITGSSNIEISQTRADRGASISQPRTSVQVQNADLQEALALLEKLKQDINRSNALNPIEKETVEVPLKKVEEELKKPKPDKSLVTQAIETLKKGLSGITELAEPVAEVSRIIAKAWMIVP
jgi:hypothetical protein